MLTLFDSLPLRFSLEALVFESPWPVVVTLALVWAMMRLVGVRLLGSERAALGRRMRTGSWGVLLIAGLVLGLAWYVQTPRERMVLSMRQLFAAVEQEDRAAFGAWTADDVEAQAFGRRWTRAEIDGQLDKITFDDITLISEGATYFPDLQEGVTVVKLRVQFGGAMDGFEGMSGLDISVWSVHWRMQADGRWEATWFEHVSSGLDASIEDAE